MKKATQYRAARRLEYKALQKAIKGKFQPWNQAEITRTVSHPEVRPNRSRKWNSDEEKQVAVVDR